MATPRDRATHRRRAGTVVRAAGLALAAYGFWVFLQPVLIAGIVNVGNVVGLAAALGLAGVVVAWPRVSRFLGARAATRAGRVGLGAVAVVVGLGVVWCGVLSARMAGHLGARPEGPATLVVVGCRVEGDEPSEALRRRADAAADYLLEHPGVPVVVSGGQGPDERISEAEAMRRLLVERGVDEGRILMEDRSTSTRENLLYSKEVLAEHGLGTSVVVVSEGYHLYRALRIAERVGLDAEGLAAESAPWQLPTSWVREWFSITLDVVRS